MVEIPHIIVLKSQLNVALVLCPLPRPHPLMGNMSGDHWALSELYQVSSTILMLWHCSIYHVSNRECVGGQWESLIAACTTSYAKIRSDQRSFSFWWGGILAQEKYNQITITHRPSDFHSISIFLSITSNWRSSTKHEGQYWSASWHGNMKMSALCNDSFEGLHREG